MFLRGALIQGTDELLSQAYKLNIKQRRGKMEFTNIYEAVRKGSPDDVKYFVEQKNIDINIKDSDGNNLVHIAGAGGRIDVFAYLISNGVDIHAKNNRGQTPLFGVSNEEKVKLLLSAGADVNARDTSSGLGRGSTPLHVVVAKPYPDYIDIAKALIDGGADVNAKRNDGTTPLIQAVTCIFADRRIEFIKFLVSNGADIKTRDNDNWTPLHWAANGDVETAKYLVELGSGADVEIRDNKGKTPLDYARIQGNTAMVEYLSSITPSSTKSSGGCYIATAVYCSYDAPEVLCLRRFRDETLSVSILGRLFIRLYYFFSPAIAEKLKRMRRINALVRRTLDKIVVRLNKKYHNQNNMV
jgi:ankyrin repeat protein